jgi:hypothetical protein
MASKDVEPTLEEQIKCVQREIGSCEWSRVEMGTNVDHEIARMKAVLKRLLAAQAAE